MADSALQHSDQGDTGGGPAPVRTRASPSLCIRQKRSNVDAIKPIRTLCSLDSNVCLQVVTARLRVVIEATASVRCLDDGKSEEFTVRTRQCVCVVNFWHAATNARFFLCNTYMLSACAQVYSVDVVSEATGARWISFRRFREFDVLCCFLRPFLDHFATADAFTGTPT